VTAVVTALVIALVALPLLSYVVDVGRLFEQRRQLQNGADAAALAVAVDYLRSRTGPGGYSEATATTTAAGLAASNYRNSPGPDAKVYGTPWRTVGPPRAGNGYEPPDRTSSSPPYVQVHVSAPNADRGFLFSFGGATVSATARATWGGLKGAATLPITLSICEWNTSTSGGTRYAPAPPYPPNPDPALEGTVALQSSSGTGCNRGPANQFVPGGFGWLDGGGTCTVTSAADGTVQGSTGSSELSNCRKLLDQVIAAKQVVFLPVFDAVSGTGSNARFHIAGYAAVVFTGYSVPGKDSTSWLTGRGKKDCPNTSSGTQGSCFYTLFTEALAPAGSELVDTELGVSVVRVVR
jgi:hypothetical protein